MYGCENWTIKKAEHWRIDAFERWCWRRLLKVPWTARRWNQSILKEISPEYLLEGLMLKLKLNTLATWCEELTHLKRYWCCEGLKAGREGNDRGWDGWMASHVHHSVDMYLNKLRELVMDREGLACCSPWGRKESNTTEQLKWTEVTGKFIKHVTWKYQSQIHVQYISIFVKIQRQGVQWIKIV